MLTKIIFYTKILRIHFFQHIILFALIPLIYVRAPLSDYIYVYVMFLILNTYGFLINDYHDFEMDKKNPRKKTLATLGILSLSQIKILNIIMVVISLVMAFYLSTQYFFFYLIIAFFVWSYSAPPFRFKTRNWLEFPIVILGFGPLNYLYTYFVYGKVDLWVAIVNFFYIFAVIGQSQLNNCIKDFESDGKSGSNNLAQHLGLKWSLYLRKALRVSTVILISGLLKIYSFDTLSLVIVLIYGVITILYVLREREDKIESLYTMFASTLLILTAVLQSR